MTTLREAAEMALGTLQDVCARLLYRGVSKDAGHPDQIALEQARQTIQALKQATEQSKQTRDPIAWNGWIVREVLFDEGEPVGHRAPPQPVAQPEREPLTDDLYNELLFAVGNKYPGETRHETALRYIKQAETGSNESAKTAHGIGCQE